MKEYLQWFRNVINIQIDVTRKSKRRKNKLRCFTQLILKKIEHMITKKPNI